MCSLVLRFSAVLLLPHKDHFEPRLVTWSAIGAPIFSIVSSVHSYDSSNGTKGLTGNMKVSKNNAMTIVTNLHEMLELLNVGSQVWNNA